MEELQQMLRLLEEDSSTERSAVLIQDYIVPILQSVLSEITNTQTAVQSVAEVSQLALLTSQRTYMGEILRQISDSFAVILQTDLPEEGPVAEAVSDIDRLLGAWMEAEQGDFDFQNLDEEYEEYDDDEEGEESSDEAEDEDEGGEEENATEAGEEEENATEADA